MWPLALLVFFASVTVPMVKLWGLVFLLISVQRKSSWRLKDRAFLFRIIESIGRWSMIDIFMISILIALVKLGSIATIEPGIGATSFAGVVVITMIASMMFDPRLMWDAVEKNTSRARGHPDTILSGVKALIEAEMWPLALLVFFASVTVPMVKLWGLVFLLISVQRKSSWRLKDRAFLFRIIESIGRWSMIDIFMISILIALVKLGSIATIEPGIGATSFAGVVVITMIASMMFDPRLMWDAVEQNSDGAGRIQA